MRTRRDAVLGGCTGSPEAWGCDPWRNWIAVRAHAYPPEVLALLAQLGINHKCESEVHHLARLPNGVHLYGGWFHCVGSIEAGEDALKPTSETGGTFELEPVGGAFKVGVTEKLGLVPESFKNVPIIQIEFLAEAPWVLSAVEPE